MIRIDLIDVSDSQGGGPVPVIINNFTAIVSGNKGERQLIIVSSPCRFGQTQVVIATATVMAGCSTLMTGTFDASDEYMLVIEKFLVNWCADGGRGKLEEVDAHRIAAVMQALVAEWEK